MRSLLKYTIIALVLPLIMGSCASFGSSNNSRFVDAAAQGDVERVQQFIDRGVDVNEPGDFDETALFAAAENNQVAVLELLVSNGADLNKPNYRGTTPAQAALNRGSNEALFYLLDQGATAELSNGNTLLTEAAQRNKRAALETLVNKYEIELDYNILAAAARNKNWELIPLLIDFGANSNDKESNGVGALRQSTENPETIQLLIDAGADVNNIPNDGVPPLTAAILREHMESAELLLQAGAELNPAYSDPDETRTPLPPLLALMSVLNDDEDLSLMRKYLEAGADPNYLAVDDDAQVISMLGYAVNYKKENMALILLDAGADPSINTVFGDLRAKARENSMTRLIDRL